MQSEPAPGFIKHPQHKIEIGLASKRYQLLFHGAPIAQSNKVLELHENNYAVRFYFPKADIQMAFLVETDHSSYCPFKGTARYWSVMSEAGPLENTVWAYDSPYRECADLVDHVCFYTEKPGFELRELNS